MTRNEILAKMYQADRQAISEAQWLCWRAWDQFHNSPQYGNGAKLDSKDYFHMARQATAITCEDVSDQLLVSEVGQARLLAARNASLTSRWSF